MQEITGLLAQDINARIAARVRALRTESGMTLDGLAVKCDVSRSMLSLVERGESSATAVVLAKIATGLGVPVAMLFDDSNAPASPIARQEDHISWRDPQSGFIRRGISPANFPSSIHIAEIILPAGARVAYEKSSYDFCIHQQVWVQSGSIEVTLGKVIHCLTEDDCLALQLNERRAFHNPTRKAARYIVATEHSRASWR